jgi:hypothetical protein
MKPIPSFDQINSALRYSPDTGELIWKDRPWLAKQINNRYRDTIAGSLHVEGYIKLAIEVDGIRVDLRAHRVAWLLMTGEWPSDQIDHKDGMKANNRWGNLRIATNGQNGSNRKAYGSSGFKGCTFYKKWNHWRAFIKINGKTKSLGTFRSGEEAHAAYCKAAELQHGEFAYHLSA